MTTAILDQTADTWTAEELAAQFRRCEKWQDPDQWEALGFLYLQAYGPMCMNAGYCFRKCDELRALGVVRVDSIMLDGEPVPLVYVK